MRPHFPPGRDRGFVHLELMVFIGLIGIGAVIGLPSFLKLLRHQPVSGWNWTGMIIGGLFAGLGAWPLVAAFFSSAFGKTPRR